MISGRAFCRKLGNEIPGDAGNLQARLVQEEPCPARASAQRRQQIFPVSAIKILLFISPHMAADRLEGGGCKGCDRLTHTWPKTPALGQEEQFIQVSLVVLTDTETTQPFCYTPCLWPSLQALGPLQGGRGALCTLRSTAAPSSQASWAAEGRSRRNPSRPTRSCLLLGQAAEHLVQQ